MRDVAERAGVSVQTVSNLVNGREHLMKPETRERVTQAMVVLEYRPNASARGLRSARTRELGFLLLDDDAKFLADPMTDMVMAGAGDVTRENGYGLLIQSARLRRDRRRAAATRCSRAASTARSSSSPGEPNSRGAYVQAGRRARQPVGPLRRGARRDAALGHARRNFDGAYQLAEHLLEKGHERIAFVAARTSWPMIEERYRGYRAALQAAAIEPRTRAAAVPRPLGCGQRRRDGGRRCSSCATRPRRSWPPTTCSRSASCARRAGAALQVPEDVAVSGFNNFDFSDFVEPALTTVSIPVYEMGRAAAAVLVDQLEGGEVDATSQSFPVEILLREST